MRRLSIFQDLPVKLYSIFSWNKVLQRESPDLPGEPSIAVTHYAGLVQHMFALIVSTLADIQNNSSYQRRERDSNPR